MSENEETGYYPIIGLLMTLADDVQEIKVRLKNPHLAEKDVQKIVAKASDDFFERAAKQAKEARKAQSRIEIEKFLCRAVGIPED